jgi:enoyl-CoA hydratase
LDYNAIEYEVRENVALITMDRPEKLNALSEDLQHELRTAFGEARDDDEVRCIILKANGRGFSAGYELTGGIGKHGSTPTHLADYIRKRTRGWFEAIWWNPKPVIAQVHGYALAGGGDLAAMCDITIASDDAIFGYPVKRMNPRPTVNLWPWIIGFKKSKELALTGRMITADEAWRIGLVNQVVARDQLDQVVWDTAQLIARSCDKRWQKLYMNAVYERAMGVGAGMQMLADGWEIDMSNEPVWTEWNRRIREEGLKSALSWRDDRFRAYDHDRPDKRPAATS